MRNLQIVADQIQCDTVALQNSNHDLARRVESLENRPSVPPAKRSNSKPATALE
jgi:hypothetical protein